MDKKRINKNKDLLYENSVSLATAEVLTFVEDILFKRKIYRNGFVGDDWTVIREMSS